MKLFNRQGLGRTLLLLLVLAVGMVCLSGCGGGSLVGQWVNLVNDNTINLFKDGTGVSANESVKWKVEGKRFVLMENNTAIVGEYNVKGYVFTWTLTDGTVVTWVRKDKVEEYKKKNAEAEKKEAKEDEQRLDKLSSDFTDSRDGQKYRTVKVGKQFWMAQNLNYQTEKGSWCNENNADNCNKYGRLYDWNTAKTACPKGWHLPSNNEWKELVTAVGSSGAGKKLKSKNGWDDWEGKKRNGTDNYGFSALPGGFRSPDGSFVSGGDMGEWWTATDGSDGIYVRGMANFFNEDETDDVSEININGVPNGKNFGYSVRCVEGDNGSQSLPTAQSAQTSTTAPTEKTKNPAALVPTGYKILQEVNGDLNKDALEDYIFVIAGKQDESRRGIVIAFNKGEDYENTFENRDIFSYNKDETAYVPDVEVVIKKGVFDIKIGERCGGGAICRLYNYRFRYQNSDFELIGYEASEYGGGNVLGGISINFLSNKMQITENKNETWNDIVIKEPIKLRKMVSFGDGDNIMKYISKK